MDDTKTKLKYLREDVLDVVSDLTTADYDDGTHPVVMEAIENLRKIAYAEDE